MKLWAALSQAVTGWMMILRGEAGWRDRFALTWPGLVNAFIIFAVIAFLAVILTSMSIGMPSLFGVLAAMVVLALPILALLITVLATGKMLGAKAPVLALMVPGTYMLTAFLIVEGLCAMIGGPIVLLSWLLLAYVLFRLARAATGWNSAVSIGFAVLSVVLLVAMRLALYMVSSAAAGSLT